MLGHLLGQRRGKAVFEGRRNARMELLAGRAQQAFVGRALYQRMLEAVAAIWAGSFRKNQAGGDQLLEAGGHLGFAALGDRVEQRP